MASREELIERIEETLAELNYAKKELNLRNPGKSLSNYRRTDLAIGEVSMFASATSVFHQERINSLCWVHGTTFSPEAKASLVTVGREGEIIIWDSKTGSPILKDCLEEADNGLNAVIIDQHDNSLLSVGGASGVVYIYRSKFTPLGRLFIDHVPDVKIKAHDDFISDLTFLNRGEIVSASADSNCSLWSAERAGPAIRTFVGHSAPVKSLSVSDVNSSCFVSGSLDETARLWDVRRGKGCVREFAIYSGVNAVKFMPGSCTTFAIGCADAFTQLLDVRAGGRVGIYPFPNFQAAVTQVEFSKSGRLMFTAGEEGSIALWDTLDESSCMQTLTGHSEQITGLMMNVEGDVLASGSFDRALTLWRHRLA
jgi:WD40 repeat protein